MKKIKHIIETTTRIIVIFKNYLVSIFIAKQISLTSFNIDKFNLKLIRISVYLSQFDLNVKYKSNKINIVSNALFKLSTKTLTRFSTNLNCYLKKIFQISLIIIIENFKKKLKAKYATNSS